MSGPKKLQGKVSVITGGTTGIGLASAKLFVKEGAYVFITGRRQKELDEAVKAIGSNVTGVQGDIAKLTDLDRLYEAVAIKGRIDVVFANAGYARLWCLWRNEGCSPFIRPNLDLRSQGPPYSFQRH